jgi:hypothetical protein
MKANGGYHDVVDDQKHWDAVMNTRFDLIEAEMELDGFHEERKQPPQPAIDLTLSDDDDDLPILIPPFAVPPRIEIDLTLSDEDAPLLPAPIISSSISLDCPPSPVLLHYPGPLAWRPARPPTPHHHDPEVFIPETPHSDVSSGAESETEDEVPPLPFDDYRDDINYSWSQTFAEDE